MLDTGTHHFQHGPIDLIVRVDGSWASVGNVEAAWQRFAVILPELVAELPVLRQPVPSSLTTASIDQRFASPVARRMGEACWPFRHGFVTPMAAVAGAVADEVLQALLSGAPADDTAHHFPQYQAPGVVVGMAETVMATGSGDRAVVRRAFVNNGGDIALYLAPGESWTVGLVTNPQAVRFHSSSGRLGADGCFTIHAGQGIGGIATSGWRGRSFSLGIADSVTVLAANAALADVAATLIANQVNADHPAIHRAPADTLKDDTDLGSRRVTVDVGPLPPEVVREALLQGAQLARQWQRNGLIAGAVLVLQGQVQLVLPDQPGGVVLKNRAKPTTIRNTCFYERPAPGAACGVLIKTEHRPCRVSAPGH
ncbi:UPF0280 family protein [Neopusillimonas aromaticivorans]|uniref:UPF0280 family protein n=1 Tax=Neopusillimonas aromaticivorans TaxID=2979868 RepID=UPI002597664B|nr:UPF0280 family protein [Neopusillimonas aromaticivorans]WJJ94771.1 UPF0280 family protein [Neopusillimonas aromaticivorans]